MMNEEEKIIQTFVNNTLGRNELVFAMANQLNSISSNRVISLEGSWGTGKTFLLKQLKYLYDNVSDDNVNKKIQVEKQKTNLKIEDIINTKIFYYDAWKNDNSKFPLLSLIYEIINESGIDFGKEEIKAELKKEEIINKVDKAVDKIFEEISKKYPILSIVNELRKLFSLDVQQNNIKDLLEKISTEKNKEQLILDIFEQIKLVLSKKKIIIIIDELDRCNPNYALRLIEEIKHYFNINNVIFILSMNINEMKCLTKKYYGDSIENNKYFDKIIDIHWFLPNIGKEKYIEQLLSKMLPCGIPEVAKLFIDYYNLELREIEKYILLIYDTIPDDILYEEKTVRAFGLDTSAKIIIYNVFLPILIGYILIDTEMYNKLVNGNGENEFLNIVFYKETYYLKSYFSMLTYGKENEDLKEKMRAFYRVCFRGEKYANNNYEIIYIQREIECLKKICEPINSYSKLLLKKAKEESEQ